jgi:plasmid stabilization system protein ParE
MRVEWSARAKRALRGRVAFLQRKNPRAAGEIGPVVQAASDRLAEFPNIGRLYQGHPGPLRELVVPFGNEGYVLQYVVRNDLVLITNVKHQREATY